MNNGAPSQDTSPTTLSTPRLRLQLKPRSNSILWKMLGVAVAFHLVLILVTSKSLFFSDKQSPEQIFEKGEQAMAGGKYLEAMEIYRQVLDLQPKVAPVFEKAAEQHRNADRLARQQAAKLTAPATRESTGTLDPTRPAAPATRDSGTGQAIKVIPATKPAFEVPPEFRTK